MKMRNLISLTSILAALLVLTGCASNKLIKGDENVHYTVAQEYLAAANYGMTISTLEQLEQRFPFSRYAEQAQYDLMYAKFKNKDYEEVIILADRMIRLQPDHEAIAYAWYLKALGRYELSRTNRSLLSGFDIATRDTQAAQKAFDDFASYLRLFPNDRYAPDARAKQIDIRNRLAQYELQIGEYYLQHGAWLAAANRANIVVTDFSESPYVDDALTLLVTAYEGMGMPNRAKRARAVQQDLRLSLVQ
jgi:outer membrane protein assembly factor BamD